MGTRSVLLMESFYCGSHKQLIDLLHAELIDSELFTLPGKKWHWKARTSALYFSQEIPRENSYRVLFASSVLNLAELVALRPDLGCLRKVLYFHENQLIYPVRKHQDRDFQYGYNQIISCMVADKVVFNSKYNMESFLSSINTFLKLIPDHRPKGITELIRPKCCVFSFPIAYPPTEVGRKHRHNEKEATDESARSIYLAYDTKDNCNCSQIKDCIAYSKEVSEISAIPNSERITTEKYGKNKDNVMLGVTPTTNTGDHLTSSRNINIEMDMRETGLAKKEFSDIKKQDSQSKKSVDNENDGSDLDSGKEIDLVISHGNEKKPLHIVWPHRWEHDKGPENFFKVMFQLDDLGLPFHLSVLGEQFTDVPDIFTEAKRKLGSKILHWGYQNKEEYFDILRQADCVVSTALHEFFGVAMLEAVYCGCYPLCPNRLVYPEIFTADYLYNTDNQLFKKLHQFCGRPSLCRNHHLKIDVHQYSWEKLKSDYKNLSTPELN